MDFYIPFNMLTLEIRPGSECLLGTTTSYSFALDFLHDETALGSDTPWADMPFRDRPRKPRPLIRCNTTRIDTTGDEAVC